MDYFYYESPIGILRIEEESGAICGINTVAERTEEDGARETELIRKAHSQLKEYFAGVHTVFDLPVAQRGTPFQQKVWAELQKIPYGETRTYAEIAAGVGNPKACRAVGGANHRNRILIVVPCHRVIGADGSLTGFGAGMDVKKFLLEREKGIA